MHAQIRCGGNWTGLFDTGEQFPSPPALKHENIFVQPGTGYDGQFHHYIAHDPWLRSDTAGFLDMPRRRYRRILIPALAHAVAAGRQNFIHAAYFSVILSAVLLGTWLLSLLALSNGLHPLLGLMFLLLPASIVSIETMTVDVALAAAALAYARSARSEFMPSLAVVCALAPLVRETGALFLAASAAFFVVRRRWRALALVCACGLPALAWEIVLRARLGPDTLPPISSPLTEIWRALVSSANRMGEFGVPGLEAWFHCLQLGGELLAIPLALRLASRRNLGQFEFACALFSVLAVLWQDRVGWQNFHAHGRVMSPLLLLLAVYAIEKRSAMYLLPFGLVLPRFLSHLTFPTITRFSSVLQGN